MQDWRQRPPFPRRPASTGSHITSAVGLEETQGRLRARRSSLFTRTVIWITGLVCLAFLLGSLAQAWSNSQLMQRLQEAQQQTQKLQAYHNHLVQVKNYYQDPSVIEREAREKLGYIRPGEHPVVVIGANDQGSSRPGQAAHPSPPQSFWQAWWNIFFGD